MKFGSLVLVVLPVAALSGAGDWVLRNKFDGLALAPASTCEAIQTLLDQEKTGFRALIGTQIEFPYGNGLGAKLTDYDSPFIFPAASSCKITTSSAGGAKIKCSFDEHITDIENETKLCLIQLKNWQPSFDSNGYQNGYKNSEGISIHIDDIGNSFGSLQLGKT